MESDIVNVLKKILIENFNFSKSTNWKKIKDIPLTSKEIGFDSIVLYYFLMTIEEKFKFCFTSSDLLDMNFYTLQNIVTILYAKVINN